MIMILLFLVFLFSISFIFDSYIEESKDLKLMRVNCCDGGYCTDTYYNQAENRCYYTLSSLFGRQWYEGENITID